MKNVYFLLFFALCAGTGCDKDRIQFYLDTFTVNDQFVDASGKYGPDAVLRFDISFRSDDPDDNDYAIENFDFTYRVNGSAAFSIQNDQNMNVDAFSVNAVVDLLNLDLPADLGGELIAGDIIEFNIRAEDSDGDIVERAYKVEVQ